MTARFTPIAAALVLAAATTFALPASAELLGASQALQIVESQGYAPVGKANFWPRRGVYVVITENEPGQRVRVMVSAHSGEIVSIDRLSGKLLSQ